MKRDAIVIYVFTTIFGCCCSAKAFLTSPSQTSQTAATQSAAKQVGSIPAEFGRYPGVRYLPGGSMLNERPVYDPGDGDELLSTLTAEIGASGGDLGTLPDYADTVFNELEDTSKYEMLRELEEELEEEQDIVRKSAILMKFLEDPTIHTLPLIYVEQASPDVLYTATGNMEKRSRYYRRYPWKRHNRHRSNYEPELRYACTPSKEDVFKLLLSLHENRKGNHDKTVQFCNRKRPAKAIFTNIRFLG